MTPTFAPPESRLERWRRPGVAVTILHRPPLHEFHMTFWPQPGESFEAMLERLAEQLQESGAQVVRHEIFGRLNARSEVLHELETRVESLDWPVTYVEGAPVGAEPVAGMHVWAVQGVEVQSARLGGRLVGRCFQSPYARHCLLGDVLSKDPQAPRPAQARQAFEFVEDALQTLGFRMTDTVRTWLFLDRILEWYDPLNQVRKDFFTERDLFSHRLPASTGVGVRNAAGAAVCMGAWAVQAVVDGVDIREVPSPLQCPAPDYGSCFSRAVEIIAPTHRRMLVSGTASIRPDGSSAHQGDPRRQVDLTMEVIEALLQSRGFDWGDVSRATAYLKRTEDAPHHEAWCRERDLFLPAVVAQADVCRDELLYEVEVDAISIAREPGQAPVPWTIEE